MLLDSLCLCHFLIALCFEFRKDATIDALDLVLDGVDTIWGWVAGSKEAGPVYIFVSWLMAVVFK